MPYWAGTAVIPCRKNCHLGQFRWQRLKRAARGLGIAAPGADPISKWMTESSLTGLTVFRSRKRSYSATSSSDSGSSLEAAMAVRRGTAMRRGPSSTNLSFRSVSSELRMALLALKTCKGGWIEWKGWWDRRGW